MAKQVVEPLNRLNLDEPMENETYEELTPLLQRIHSQHQEITLLMQLLKRKQQEFDKITGIGIAQEHLPQIFDRFYRVDKSHSRKSGGTGLGMSIVKHAVKYHHGTINIDSDIGKGTRITVTLKKII